MMEVAGEVGAGQRERGTAEPSEAPPGSWTPPTADLCGSHLLGAHQLLRECPWPVWWENPLPLPAADQPPVLAGPVPAVLSCGPGVPWQL